jgi:hypothetical protein
MHCDEQLGAWLVIRSCAAAARHARPLVAANQYVWSWTLSGHDMLCIVIWT